VHHLVVDQQLLAAIHLADQQDERVLHELERAAEQRLGSLYNLRAAPSTIPSERSRGLLSSTPAEITRKVEQMPGPEIDRIVFQTAAVQVGAFRCPIGHPLFTDSGPIRNHCFVFPRTPVIIRHRDERPFAADATLVTLYNKGQEYRRTPTAIAEIGTPSRRT